MNYIKRLASNKVLSLLKDFPIISILGPRQCGKTTLVKHCLPKTFEYYDLEKPSDFDFISRDIEFFLQQKKQIVIDEAQRLPELFPALRAYIDQNPKHKVVLLGSSSPSLVKKISESLTGRLAIVELSPLLIWEVKRNVSPLRLWEIGTFPALHTIKKQPHIAEWYSSYLKTHLEQDLPNLGFKLPSVRLRRLLQMLAHLHGSILNSSELGSALGVNYQTIQFYIDIFEALFLIRRLQPYYINIGKRLAKNPKIYIRDSGLLHYLLGISQGMNQLLSHPKVGFSWEGFIIEQLIQLAKLNDPSSEAYFWKTGGGAEIDLLLKLHGKVYPIEIKMGVSIPNTKAMEQCLKDLNSDKGFIIYRGEKLISLSSKIFLVPFDLFIKKDLSLFKKS